MFVWNQVSLGDDDLKGAWRERVTL